MSLYTARDYPTKKAVKNAVKAGVKVRVFQPGPFTDGKPLTGTFSIEGRHYPKPHTWYGRVVVKDGFIVKIS